MIYFPGRTYTNFFGGAEVLIINIVTELRRLGIQVGLIGNIENDAVKILNEKNIDFKFIDSSQEIIILEKEDVLIIFNYTSDLLKIRGNPKVFLWCILSLSLTNHNKTKLNYRLNELLKFVTKRLYWSMYHKGSLSFMDKSTYTDVTSYFKLNVQPKYLPIPVESYKYISDSKYIQNKEITITYLGRGNEIWKIYPLLKILEDIHKNSQLEKITLYIITDTDILFKKLIAKPENVIVNYIFGLKEKTLHKFLCENSQLHFAMGTSALEGSICRIPTVLMDASFQLFPFNYKYKWVFETESYSLGCFIERTPPIGYYSMEEIINTIATDTGYDEIASKCYHYTKTNHTISRAVDILVHIKPNFAIKSYLFYCKEYWMSLIHKIIN